MTALITIDTPQARAMDPMDPAVKAKWLEALRSDEFVQGKNYLCADGNYCCLGVLSELAFRDGAVSKSQSIVRETITTYGDFPSTGVTPTEVVRWAGLSQEIPYIPVEALSAEQVGRLEDSLGDRLEVHLDGRKVVGVALLNDNGLTFGEIADLIEAHL